MAGDWIPMRMDLLDDPAVIAIAAAVGLDEYAVAGRLLKLWSWANKHLKDGHVFVPDKWVDDYLDTAGFAAAMLAAGWLRTRSGGGLEFTSFDRWNSNGAKIRLGETLRKRAFRQKKTAGETVPKLSRTKGGDSPGPKKRREESNTPLPPTGGGGGETQTKFDPASVDLPHPSPAFRSAWLDWIRHRAEKKQRLTPTATAQQLKKLGQLSEADAIACIERSVTAGWIGLFPDQGKPAPPPAPPPPPIPEPVWPAGFDDMTPLAREILERKRREREERAKQQEATYATGD